MDDKRFDTLKDLELAQKVIEQRRGLKAQGLDGPYYKAFFDAAVDMLITSIAGSAHNRSASVNHLSISTSFTGYSEVVTRMRTSFLDAVDPNAGHKLVFATLYSLRPVQWFNYATSEPKDLTNPSTLSFKHVKTNPVFKKYIQDSFDHSRENVGKYRVDRIMVGVHDDLANLTTIPSYSMLSSDLKLQILLHRDLPVTFQSSGFGANTTSIHSLKDISPCAFDYLSMFDEEELEGSFVIHPRCDAGCGRLKSRAYELKPLGDFLKHCYHVEYGHKLRLSKIEPDVWKDYLQNRKLAEDFFMVGLEGTHQHQTEPDWCCCLAGDTSDSLSGVSLSCYAGGHVKLRDYKEFWNEISSKPYVQELR